MARSRHESRRSHCWTLPNQLGAPGGQHARILPRSTWHRCVLSTPRQSRVVMGVHRVGGSHQAGKSMPTPRPSRNRVGGLASFMMLDAQAHAEGFQSSIKHRLLHKRSQENKSGQTPPFSLPLVLGVRFLFWGSGVAARLQHAEGACA